MKRHAVASGVVVVLAVIATSFVAPKSMSQAPNSEEAVSQLVPTWLNAESEGGTAALD